MPTISPSRLTSASGVTLRLLEIFVAVAEAGSMNAAAELLRSSQPAVSLGINTL